MGAGRKRKNSGIGIDFRKAKHKVGKTLKKPRNDTDTTIKSHAIHLPTQSVATDKEGTAVTTRNLTLKELISQVNHYNAKMRRDSLVGMMELFEAHPEVLPKHVGSVIEAVGERTSDVDAGVRSTLFKLLSDGVLPKMGSGNMKPFMPLMMAHVCSAMTHMAIEVRGDALKFLNELMKYEHEMIVADFLAECLDHFSDMCGNLGRSQTLQNLSHESKLKVLNAINCFLEKVCSADNTGEHDGISHTVTEDRLPLQHRCNWISVETNQAHLRRQSHHNSEVVSILSACHRLLGCLTTMFTAGCAGLSETEAQLSPTNIQFVTASLDSLVHLLMVIRAKASDGYSKEVLKYCKIIAARIHPTFPMALPTVKGSPDGEQLVSRFNIAAAKLLLQVVLTTAPANSTEVSISEPLVAFYSDILEEASNPGSLPDVVALLPDVFNLLTYLKAAERISLLEAIRTTCVSVEDIKAKYQFLKFFLDVVKAMLKKGKWDPNDEEDKVVVEWLKLLPKIMWDAGVKNAEMTKVCLSILHTAARRQSSGIVQQLKVMQRELMLMFAIARESSNNKGIRARPGHLHRLPLGLQELAVDILYFVPSLSDLTLFTSLTICLMESFPVETCGRLLSIIGEKVVDGGISARALSCLIMGLLTGDSDWKIVGNKLDVMDWERSLVLCSAACELFWSAGSPIVIVQSVESELLKSFELFSNHRVHPVQLRKLYGLLSLLSFARNCGVPFGEDSEALLPDVLLHYWIAGISNEASLFCRTLASWESPLRSILMNSRRLPRRLIHLLHNGYREELSGGNPSHLSSSVKRCESRTRALYSLLHSSCDVVAEEKGTLTAMFSTITSIIDGITVGTQSRSRFKEEFGKCVAHCEHLWGSN